MSLSDIRSECVGVAGLLQPFVDGELATDEQERVAAHLDGCRGCRVAVTEQAWVRATLHALPREAAPQAVRARVLLALDEVDRDAAAHARQAEAASRPSLWSRMWRRLGDLGRGGLIMVPAGAAAIGLFFVVKDATVPPPSPIAAAPALGIGGALDGAQASAPAATDDDPTAALAELEPRVGFEPQVPGTAPDAEPVQLVGAAIDDSTDRAARLRFQLWSGGRPTGNHVIDRQVRADGLQLRGEPVTVDGRAYHIERDERGAAVVHFVVGSIGHTVRLEGTAHLSGADLIDDAGHRTPSDVAALLRFALGFHGPNRH